MKVSAHLFHYAKSPYLCSGFFEKKIHSGAVSRHRHKTQAIQPLPPASAPLTHHAVRRDICLYVSHRSVSCSFSWAGGFLYAIGCLCPWLRRAQAAPREYQTANRLALSASDTEAAINTSIIATPVSPACLVVTKLSVRYSARLALPLIRTPETDILAKTKILKSSNP